MNTEDILAQALDVKHNMDELTLLGDSLYVCMSCGQVSDYWKIGGVCQTCERLGEEQQEREHES